MSLTNAIFKGASIGLLLFTPAVEELEKAIFSSPMKGTANNNEAFIEPPGSIVGCRCPHSSWPEAV